MSMPGRILYAPLGSISSGTHREKDLLEAFGSALQSLVRKNDLAGIKLDSNVQAVNEECKALGNLMDSPGSERWFKPIFDSETFSHFLNEELYEALNEFAPPCCHFGAHEGDGADFGFWFSQEAYDDCVEQGDIKEVQSLDESQVPHGVIQGMWSDDQPAEHERWSPKWIAVTQGSDIFLYRYRLDMNNLMETEEVLHAY